MRHLEMSVHECTNTSAPFELSIASATVSAFLILVTVPTNLLVCLAVILDPNRELRTQFNCFTFNLALADLMVGCVAEPVSIYSHVTEALDSSHGHEVKPAVLKIFHVVYFISAMASVLSIAALACERFLAINSPFSYRRYFNVKLTVILSSFIWVIALSFGMLNLIFDYILESLIFINTGVLFTGIVVFYVCRRIRTKLRQTSKQLVVNRQHKEKQFLIQVKLTKTFALMIGTLLLCYAPACVMVYFINICTNCNCELIQWFRDTTFWLVLLNSAIDPYVYAIRSRAYRKAIHKILTCKCWPSKGMHKTTFSTLKSKKAQKFPSVRFSKLKPLDKQKSTTWYGSLDTTSTEDEQIVIEKK